tara:strand:- start:201 stop:695 length:495 start_codon:yes stop_codon:yes gene_type:complete
MMSRLLLLILISFIFLGCKSTDIHEGKVIHHDEYDQYYVVKEQGTDKNIQEKVETFTDKVKKVFKKDPVKSTTPIKSPKINPSKLSVTNNVIKASKKLENNIQPVSKSPIIIGGKKLMPMTNEQVEIVDLKNTFISTITIIQSVIILCLAVYLVYKLKSKKKKK